MADFVTVFEISRNSNGVFAALCFDVFIAVGALMGGARILIRGWRKRDIRDWIFALLFLGWGFLWFYLGVFPRIFGQVNGLVDAYRSGQYEIVEGAVQVLHRQPATGHTKGDVIAINGKQFEVNYFYFTPAYNKTLAKGGVLGDGVYARLYTYNGEILRVDLRK